MRRLVETPDLDPLVCTAEVAAGDADQLEWPIVIYDGWHRAAAWLIRAREGRPAYRLTAHLITTKYAPVRPAVAYFRPG